MSDILNKPIEPSYWQQIAEGDAKREEDEQRIILDYAKDIREACDILPDILFDGGVDPDTTVISGRERLIHPAKTAMRRMFAPSKDPYVDPDPHFEGEVHGWTLSKEATSQDKKSVVLTEDGKLLVCKWPNGRPGGPYTTETVWDRKRSTDASQVDLNAFPCNALFATERGYKETTNKIPDLVRQQKVTYQSPEHYVLVNLEEIATGLARLHAVATA